MDADHLRVYQGRVEAPRPPKKKRLPFWLNPDLCHLAPGLAMDNPANLTDPTLSNFTPASCKTLHDIARFAHQMAVTRCLIWGTRRPGPGAHGPLKTTIP